MFETFNKKCEFLASMINKTLTPYESDKKDPF